jgi:hypothetical protein
MHARLLRERRVSDEKLEHIIMLIKGMLEHESTRPKASEVYRNIRRILREEEDHHYMSSLRMRKATPPQLPPRPTPPRLTPHNTPKNPPQTPPQLPSGASGLNIFNTDIHLQDSLGRNGSAGLYNSPGPSSGNRPFPEHLSQLASPQLSFIRSPRDSPGLRTIYGPPSQGHNSFGFSPVAERTPSVHNALHNNRQNGHPSTATFPASPIRSSTTNTTQDSNERISIQDVLNWSARSRSGKLPAVLEEIKGRLIRRDHVCSSIELYSPHTNSTLGISYRRCGLYAS